LKETIRCAGVHRELAHSEIRLAEAPVDARDVWLRLHLLSRCLVPPRGLDLTGIFSHLSNVVWTSAGPCSPLDFERTRMRLQTRGD
jgi:2,3,4,5-tetrahydropyridine-2-carboxylate N-succinyltransferase